MTMATHWCFQHLGIAPTPDKKVIKRAYAHALKKIDQGHEREAFQTLRRAYEQALHFADTWEDDEEEPVEQDALTFAVAPEHLVFDLRDILESPGPTADEVIAPTVEDEFEHPPAPAHDELRDSLLATREWIEALFLADEDSRAEVVLEQALDDPRMTHLDSQSQFEAQLADRLYQDHEGRVALFNAVAARFEWTERNSRSWGSPAATQWIWQVVNQDVQWHEQGKAAQTLQSAALRAINLTTTPSSADAFKYTPILEDVLEQFPEWFALRVTSSRLHAWRKIHAAILPGQLRKERLKTRYFGNWSRFAATVLGLTLCLALAKPLLTALFFPKPAPLVQEQSAQTSATPEPVLTFEFTGAVTRDSCDDAHEFAHQSNWLEIDDGDANALFTTRLLLCQQDGLWKQANDPLLACLKKERVSALIEGRPEAVKVCLAVSRDG